jgi:hypothetical protein
MQPLTQPRMAIRKAVRRTALLSPISVNRLSTKPVVA